MKTSKQQSRSFRNALHAEKAREAYREARRASTLAQAMRELEAHEADPDFASFWEPIDLSAHAPTPSANGWQGLGA